MTFENLKRQKNLISKLVDEASRVSGGGEKSSGGDDRMWKPTVDKAGNGYAVIRFLPAPPGEELPWVRYWDHGFKGPTGLWYIEKSLTSIGQTDPVGELNSRLWNSGNDADKETARIQKRRLHYVSNIMVLNDPGNPANEGKIFLYQYGKKIFDKIMDMMQPSFQDEEPVNPFDFWEGASFKLKIRQVEGYRNYDKSEFSAPSALLDGDDEKLEATYNTLYSLSEFTDPKNYKSYDELKQKLNRVLELENTMPVRDEIRLGEEQRQTPMRELAPQPIAAASQQQDDDEEEDTLSYFARIANSD